VTGKIVSEMTYNVSNAMLNCTLSIILSMYVWFKSLSTLLSLPAQYKLDDITQAYCSSCWNESQITDHQYSASHWRLYTYSGSTALHWYFEPTQTIIHPVTPVLSQLTSSPSLIQYTILT